MELFLFGRLILISKIVDLLNDIFQGLVTNYTIEYIFFNLAMTFKLIDSRFILK